MIGLEKAGPPVEGGVFERAWRAIRNYEFSDPTIVVGHFEPKHPLLGRRMLLEIKVFGLRYLCGVVVGAVDERQSADSTLKAFRYDTLRGHIESGNEWFVLTKEHGSGEVWFRIQAHWELGRFPNWWSRTGFRILGQRYQLAWHRLAYLRLREIVGSTGASTGSPRASPLRPIPSGRRLIHVGPYLRTVRPSTAPARGPR